MNCRIKYRDGRIEHKKTLEYVYGEYIRLTLQENLDHEKIEYIDFDTERSITKVGENGYFCIVQGGGNSDNGLCFFKEREDGEYYIKHLTMPIIGVKNNTACYLGIVTGAKEIAGQVITLKNGVYKTYIRFNIDCEKIYEPIEMRIYQLDNGAEYSHMAQVYRNYQLNEGGFKPIRKRLTPELEYASESVYVRIRQAWKPVPCKILEQTPQNEPPVHVACTFAQVIDIMNMYRKKGVEKAEFCLVGWNFRGHDGRWPQILPAEPSLGGEDDLRALIAHAEKLGYVISCHTNFTDAYSVAENFKLSDIIKTKTGNCSLEYERWSGGRTYNVCPEKALQNAKNLLNDVRMLGFSGLHYIDVITAVPPRNCHHSEHPVNYKEGAKFLSEVLDYARKLFGGSASESSYDYSLSGCDYTLYTSFGRTGCHFSDKYIPLWQLVYNGIIMSNPYSQTVNAIFSKNPDDMLRVIEYNARPAIYYYAHFVDDESNWIGEDDFTYEKNELCAEAAKKHYDIFKELAYLQTEFMQMHEETEPGVVRVTYSDGSVITVDYNKKTYSLTKGEDK